MTARPMADAVARRRIEQELETTFVVEAAAGTGKTTALVERIAAVVARGSSLERIVAVTFTDKAAGEMKLRLRTRIDELRKEAGIDAALQANLDRALGELEAARITTIHAFCADLLHERPVEADVDPVFEVLPDGEARRLFAQAFDEWFQRALQEPPEGVRRLLRRRARGRGDSGPGERLAEAGFALTQQRDFHGAWRQVPFEREAAIDAVVARLRALAELSRQALDREDWLSKGLAEIERFIDELDHRESVSLRDYDGLESELVELSRPRWGNRNMWKWNGRSMLWFADGVTRDAARAERDQVKAELDAFVRDAEADLAWRLRQELRPLLVSYELLKGKAGKLDFLDLLLRARDLVRDDAAVRAELQGRFDHIFVDEFQDTDPLQAELLILLAAENAGESRWRNVRVKPGKLFIVGDPKQSIYRFRRADIALYEEAKKVLEAQGAEVLYLTTSFRSVPSLQRAINAAFAPLMAPGEGSQQPAYVPLSEWREECPSQPSLVALPVPRPYSTKSSKVTQWSIDESYPDAVAAWIDWLVNRSGWTVEEGEKRERVRIEARHVCILLKRFQKFDEDNTRRYVDALEARRLPHVLVGGRSFHDREEIVALRAALSAIEWPDDELQVFATLRGPYFALSDEQLLAYRHVARSLHPMRRLDEEELAPAVREVAEALGALRGLHDGRNRRPIADTIAQLLEITRAPAGVAIWPTGEQALANLLRMMDLARRFEAGGATSFRAFIDHLEEEAERGNVAEAPVVEEGTEGVRIMTVHRAKGLQFPVVVLADPTAPRRRETPTRWVDPAGNVWAEAVARCVPWELHDHAEEVVLRDEEETIRLAYVAATRARDLLVVPAVGDEDLSGWLEVLNPVVYPEAGTRRQPSPAPACPAFGVDTVFERPDDPRVRLDGSKSVAPGLHRPRVGMHGVVWWDPHLLELDKEHEVGLRQQEILVAEEGAREEPEGVRVHREWMEDREAVLARGTQVKLPVRTATALAHELAAGGVVEAVPVEHFEVDIKRHGRPHGKRFGELVHALLAAVDLEASRADVDRAADVQGRLLGASPDEIAAAASCVAAALGHPLIKRAAGASRCLRETPIVHALPDGTLVDGVVDLAFREEREGKASWMVVDFKTDVELGARQADYEAQVRLYARGLAAATGEEATPALLRL